VTRNVKKMYVRSSFLVDEAIKSVSAQLGHLSPVAISSWTAVSHVSKRAACGPTGLSKALIHTFFVELSLLKRANEEKKNIYFFPFFLGAAGHCALIYDAYARQMLTRWRMGTALASKYSCIVSVSGSGVRSLFFRSGLGSPLAARAIARSRVSRSASLSMKRCSSATDGEDSS